MIVNVPGVGNIEFPEGTTVEQANKAIQEYLQTRGTEKPSAKTQPKLEILEQARNVQPQPLAVTDTDVGRQLGLTGRAAVTGALGLPALASDALVSLINMIGRQNLPMPSQAQQELLTRAGLPEPQTPQERTVQDVASAGFGVLGAAGLGSQLPASMAASRELLTASPIFQATAGGAGALGSALAREEGLGPLEQVGAGMLAGTVAPTAGTAAVLSAQAAARGGRELVRPFTEAGREVIAGNILRQLSRDPEAAVRNLEAYQAGVPGYTPTTAQAARDVGLAGNVAAVRGLDVTGKFTEQMMSANRARLAVLDRLAKNEEAVTAAINKRKTVTDPLREEAFARVTVTPDEFIPRVQSVVDKIDEVLASDAGRRTAVQKAMNFAKAKLTDPNAPVFTPQQAYEVRKDLRDAAEGLLDKDQGVFRLAAGELRDVMRVLDQQINDVAPGYSDYLKKFARASTGIDRLVGAQTIRGKVVGTTPVINEPSNQMEYMLSQRNFVNAIRAAEKDLEKAGLSRTQLAVLKKVSNDLDEATFNVTQQPGSNTFRNLSVANVMGGIIGKSMFNEVPANMRQGILSMNWLYNGSDDMIREVIVDAMLDPKLAARLMRRATTAEMVPLSKELQKRALRLGYGQVFGLTEE